MKTKLEKKTKIEKRKKLKEREIRDERAYSFVEKLDTECYNSVSTWHNPKFGGKHSVDKVLVYVVKLQDRFLVAVRCFYCRDLMASCEIIGDNLSGVDWERVIDKVRECWRFFKVKDKLAFFKQNLV
ncbi:MAG: hypothetical protein ABIK77_03385 [candidate division WOR-3 bacterium]|uniref:Uncharacterized protein n=1 Tax=candidate division WOR-3 bacterium TaxID=2052148 RepID=A0A7V4CIJ3_UNCW3